MNPHLDRPPVSAGAALESANAAAVVIHGRGQDPRYMLDNLVDRMGLVDIAYLLPQAFEDSWYPGRFAEPREANQPRLSQALEACENAVQRILRAGVPIEKTALVGFSQGGCLVADMAALEPRPYGALAILTGSLTGPDSGATAPKGSLEGVPVLCGSSRYDEWVPIDRVKATADAFRKAGADVELQTYEDREHIICASATDAVRSLLSRVRDV